MENANSAEYLEKIKIQVIENIKRAAFAPSVQMMDVPPNPLGMDDEADAELDDLDEDENKDARYTQRRWDKRTEKDGELSESEDEDTNERNGVRRSGGRKRMNIMDYQNPNAVQDDDEPVSRNLSRRSSEVNGEAKTAETNGAPEPSNQRLSQSPRSNEISSAAVEPTGTDGDVEMGEDAPEVPAVVVGPQGATPPDSPKSAKSADATADAAPVPEDHPMDEAESSATAQANGIQERDEANTTAEQSTELAQEIDQS